MRKIINISYAITSNDALGEHTKLIHFPYHLLISYDRIKIQEYGTTQLTANSNLIFSFLILSVDLLTSLELILKIDTL